MLMEIVSSSNIRSVGWEGGTLRVRFNNGRTYEYSNVSEGLFENLKAADSVGQYFNAYVKNQYPATEV